MDMNIATEHGNIDKTRWAKSALTIPSQSDIRMTNRFKQNL
jgi:hypothetical protein